MTLSWLFNVYMNDVERKFNARILGSGLSLVNADYREWKINRLLFVNETA